MTRNTAKKGITAVVAIVLLLMMTIAAAALAYSWISQMQNEQQKKGTAQLDKQTQQMQGSLDIESMYKVGNDISFVIRNTGSTTVDFNSTIGGTYYVDGVPAPTNPITISTLAPGDTTTVTTTDNWPAAGNANAKTIKVVTVEGIIVEHTCSVATTQQSSC